MNKGQSLFEVVVAIAISALIIVAIVSLVTNSVRNSTFSKNQSLAATYAQQATEWLRGQRDTNTDAFILAAKSGKAADGTATYCLPDLTDLSSLTSVASFTSCSGMLDNSLFTRYVILTPTTATPPPSGNQITLIEADITVSWSDSQGSHKVTSATSFTDWRQR